MAHVCVRICQTGSPLPPALSSAVGHQMGLPPGAIPFVIMTSDDTHAKTLALLEAQRHFDPVPGSTPPPHSIGTTNLRRRHGVVAAADDWHR